MSYLQVLALLSYWSALQWALPTENGQGGVTGEVIQSGVSGAVLN